MNYNNLYNSVPPMKEVIRRMGRSFRQMPLFHALFWVFLCLTKP